MKTKTENFYIETGEMQLTASLLSTKSILIQIHGEEEDLDGEWEYNCASIVLNKAQVRELINELQKMTV